MLMLHTIKCYLYLFFSLLFMIPSMRKLEHERGKTPAGEHSQKVWLTTSRWAQGLVKSCGARLHVTGVENIPKDRAVLFVSNHQSDFDIVAYMTCLPLPIGFVAKIEMLKVPLIRTWMKLMRCVFMDRKDIRQSAKIILEGIGILKSGHSLVVFPEGTRSKSDTIQEFKPGSLKLATKSKAVVIPITMNGSYKVMEGNNYKIKPEDVYVTLHTPIFTETLDNEGLAALPQQVEETIRAGLKI